VVKEFRRKFRVEWRRIFHTDCNNATPISLEHRSRLLPSRFYPELRSSHLAHGFITCVRHDRNAINVDRSRSCQLTILLHQVELSDARPPDHSWKRQPGRPRVKCQVDRPATSWQLYPSRLSVDELLVVVSRKRRYGPRWLRVNYVNEWWVRLSVCLSVCPQGTTRAIFTKMFVHVAYGGRGSVLR